MKAITYRNLKTQIENGKLNLNFDLYGSSPTLAEVTITKTGKTEVMEVVGSQKGYETFFNLK
jgi:hypothetical protein